jgi:ABC-type branched-subunit amino acid transport system substrate-binding protein
LKLLGIVAISAVFMAGLTGQARAKDVEIVIGNLIHLTGAYAAVQAGIQEGVLDGVEYLNKVNYVPGAKLKAIWVDGGTDAAKSLTGLKKMLANKPKPVIVHGESTGIGIALKKWYVKSKVPSLEAGTSDVFGQEPSWTFSPNNPYVNLCGAWVDYYLKHIWKDKTRKPRFAFLAWDNAFGRAAITPNVKKYIQSKGVEIVAEEFIPAVPVDTTAQLLRLKEKKVDFTYGGFYYNALAPVLKDADKLGMIDDLTIGVTSFPVDELPKLAGDLTRNVWDPHFWFPASIMAERAPVIAKAYKDGGYTKISMTVYGSGFAMMQICAELIRIAAEDVGVENVDGPAVYNARLKVKDIDGFGYYSPISWPGGRWYGRDTSILLTYEDEKPVFKGFIPAPDLTEKFD